VSRRYVAGTGLALSSSRWPSGSFHLSITGGLPRGRNFEGAAKSLNLAIITAEARTTDDIGSAFQLFATPRGPGWGSFGTARGYSVTSIDCMCAM
jgi:hypothetical protein